MSQTETLPRRVGIVVGGASGIGLGTAARMAADGYAVLVADLAEGQAGELIERYGDRVRFLAADVTDAGAGEAVIAAAVAAFGRVDAVVNAAGVTAPVATLDELDGADFDRVTGINLDGCYVVLKAAIAHMKANGGGAIVNVSSVAGIKPFPFSATYSATKAGVIALTKATAIEAAPFGVRVNCVCPGVTDTPLFRAAAGPSTDRHIEKVPLRRVATPAEVAAGIVWLLGDDAAYVTGVVLPLDGGLSLI